MKEMRLIDKIEVVERNDSEGDNDYDK